MSLAISSKGKSKKRKTNTRVWFWVDECRYSVIVDNVKGLGWKLVDEERHESKSNMYWIDVAAIHERFRSIQAWQTINHFPGMPNIARKNRMGQNLNRMLKIFPREYSFYPRTWVLPGEMADFRAQFDNQGNSLGNKIYIIKPDTGCQGRGIFLTRTFDLVPQHENVVAQLYIKKPLLLDGFKFDLRIYCLVSSVKPLRMYLFHDGLVRMCTEEYVKPTKQNISNTCMHLTNYAVNKHNSNFQQPSAKSSSGNQDEGSKRSVSWFINYIREQRGDAKADWLWNRIGILCVRTVLSIIPILSREYDQHFRSFGGIPYVFPTVNPDKAYGGAQGGGSVSRSSSKVSSRSRSASNPARKNSISRAKSKDDEDEDGDEEEDEDEEDEEELVASGRRGRSETKDRDHGKITAKQEEEAMREGEEKVEGGKDSNREDIGGDKADEPELKMPGVRGSRCFEILGFDIMVDSQLQPWLIEVNHLPSFGTDSPLDLDIKERLMYQTLRSLAVLPDDEQAYLQHHKTEAEKRLMARRERDKEERQMEIAGIIGRDKPTPLPARSMGTRKSLSSRLIGAQCRDRDLGSMTPVTESTVYDAVETLEDIVDDSFPLAPRSNVTTEQSPEERVLEIRRLLLEIYAQYSLEKVPKIDRLLGKYTGREEEFLRFVYQKYGIEPPNSCVSISIANNVVTVTDKSNASGGSCSSSVGVSVNGSGSYSEATRPADGTECAGNSKQLDSEGTARSLPTAGDSANDASSGGSSRGSSGSPNVARRASIPRGRDREREGGQLVVEVGGTGKSSFDSSSPCLARVARSCSTGDIDVSGCEISSGPNSNMNTTVSGVSNGSNSTEAPSSSSNPNQRNQLLAQIQKVANQRESRPVAVTGRGTQRGVSPSLTGRSQSPPAPRRNLAANWKTTADEDLAYRAEVLQTHFPSETDEWMMYEMRALKEFTRIFPPEKKIVEKAFGEELEGDDEEGDEDDEAPSSSVKLVSASAAALPSKHATPVPIITTTTTSTVPLIGTPVATYEEIIYQVFLRDKRSAMRLHNPLPNRSVVRADVAADPSSLPPLEHPNRPQIGTMAAQAGKGLGWRAPAAKQPDRRDVLRNPTQTQVDSAKRLSQGLSVSLSYNLTKEAGAQGNGPSLGGYVPGAMSHRQPQTGMPAVVVLDQDLQLDHEIHPGPQSYYQQHQNQIPYSFQQQHFQGQGQGQAFSEAENGWPKRSNRLIEEHRVARIRVEAAKHTGSAQPYTPAVVLRQQVFAFDGRGGGASFSSSPQIAVGNEYQAVQSAANGKAGSGGNTGMLRYPVQSVGRVMSSYDIGNTNINSNSNNKR